MKAVAAIDPALHHGLTVAQASDVLKPVLLIGLGQGADRLPDTRRHSSTTRAAPT